jgi:HNH endonuclease
MKETAKTAGSRKRNGQHQKKNWISKSERFAIYLRDGFLCSFCGRDLHGADPQDLTLDHLICRSKGGSDTHTNVVLACRSCNSSRGCKAWRSYAPGGAIERILNQRRRDMKRYRVLAKAIISGRA